MENTIENKAKLFAQYWGQNILKINGMYDVFLVNDKNIKLIEKDFLVLKSLKDISDEDAIEVAKIMGMKGDDVELVFIGRMLCNGIFDNSEANEATSLYNMNCEAADYLRSKGYALPWMGVSVEQQTEYGWVNIV